MSLDGSGKPLITEHNLPIVLGVICCLLPEGLWAVFCAVVLAGETVSVRRTHVARVVVRSGIVRGFRA